MFFNVNLKYLITSVSNTILQYDICWYNIFQKEYLQIYNENKAKLDRQTRLKYVSKANILQNQGVLMKEPKSWLHFN